MKYSHEKRSALTASRKAFDAELLRDGGSRSRNAQGKSYLQITRRQAENLKGELPISYLALPVHTCFKLEDAGICIVRDLTQHSKKSFQQYAWENLPATSAIFLVKDDLPKIETVLRKIGERMKYSRKPTPATLIAA